MAMSKEEFAVIRERAVKEAATRDAANKAAIDELTVRLKYFDIGKHWPKLKLYAEHPEARRRLDRDIKIYCHQRQLELQEHLAKYNQELSESIWSFPDGTMPRHLDTRDWREDRRGRPPAFDMYVCAGFCHWSVNWGLAVLELAFPKMPWAIASSDDHSVVWDGTDTIFDITYFSRGISLVDSYCGAFKRPGHRLLTPGQELKLYL